MFKRLVDCCLTYWLSLFIVACLVLVQFLPYYLQSLQRQKGMNIAMTAIVVKLERNIFGNAKPAIRLSEQSCTVRYQFTIENTPVYQSYRDSCDKFSGLSRGSLFDILLDPATHKSIPKQIIHNHLYLSVMVLSGSAILLMSIISLLYRSFINRHRD